MMPPLTAEQAIERLRIDPDEYRTPENLRELASRVDAEATGRLTVLYSGAGTKDVWSTHIITAMLDAGEDIRVIEKARPPGF